MTHRLACAARAATVTCFVAGSTIALAQGPSIFVDVGSLNSGFGVPGNSLAGAAAGPGVWNAVNSDTFTGLSIVTSDPLLDTNGAATGVTMTFDGLGVNLMSVQFDEQNTLGDDQALLDDGYWVNGSSEVRIDGLPAGSYSVITYGMAPDSNTAETLVSVLGSSDPQQGVVGDFSGGYGLGITHALHTVDVTAAQPLVIQIDVGLTYDTVTGIQVFPAGTGPAFGTSYCGPAQLNSTGVPGTISATGEATVSANNVTLSASDLPRNSFGFFVVSQVQGFVSMPGGSSGDLCLGGAIGRYVGAGQIQNAGQAGAFSLALDLTQVPQPAGFVSVQPGQAWNFQCWYRDSLGGTATSNFTDALEIAFL